MLREGIILCCNSCNEENYITKRNKKKQQKKLEIKKYCSKCLMRTLHKEKR